MYLLTRYVFNALYLRALRIKLIHFAFKLTHVFGINVIKQSRQRRSMTVTNKKKNFINIVTKNDIIFSRVKKQGRKKIVLELLIYVTVRNKARIFLK